MIQSEIKTNNIIIAEFDGWNHCGMNSTLSLRDKYLKGYEETSIKDLNYQESWELLMPIVEKIEKMDYGFKMCRKVVEVYIDSTKETIIKTKESCRIDSLYKAVVEFIKWYNEQKYK